ncbi:hypothetical protein [Rheinheimera soli]|uniref:Tetratricopeptide repeat protein n=1 Tax=Rheinheimera soli TaxID=443616 RepID=A0ABU1W097_9GAMM|nr:hypothetical protein [Rheinheimera soli]MDR7121401.1 hypothetical protein [Rheinheimera soli]
MKFSSITASFCLVGLLSATTVQAHTDHRLERALQQDPVKTGQVFQQASVLAQLANLYKEVGDEANYKLLLKKSEALQPTVADSYVQQYLKGHTANEIASSGDFTQALAVLDSISDTEVWIKTAWKISAKLAKADKQDQTRQLLEQCIKKAHAVPELELRSELISGTGASFRYLEPEQGVALVYEAFGIAQSLTDPYERALHFNETGAHLMDIKHKARALAVFDEVLTIVPQIEDKLQKTQVLVMLGGEQAEKGERVRAAQALDQAWEIAASLPASEESYAVQSEIARNYGQSYQYDKGIRVAEQIKDPYHAAEGYIRIAKNMYKQKAGDATALLQKAELLVAAIQDPYQQAVVLRKVASEYMTMKDEAKVRHLLAQALQSSNKLNLASKVN